MGDSWQTNAEYELLKNTKGIASQDVIEVSRDALPDYDQKMNMFTAEHMHADDEIRYVEDGKGFFDVRDKEDRWIRMAVSRNDLLILPAGIYHSFEPDKTDYIKLQ